MRWAGADIKSLVGWFLPCLLRFGRFRPPGEIVGKSASGLRQRRTRLPYWCAMLVECLADWPDGNCAGNNHHTHFRQNTVPRGVRPRTRKTAGGITGDGGRTPEPFFEE